MLEAAAGGLARVEAAAPAASGVEAVRAAAVAVVEGGAAGAGDPLSGSSRSGSTPAHQADRSKTSSGDRILLDCFTGSMPCCDRRTRKAPPGFGTARWGSLGQGGHLSQYPPSPEAPPPAPPPGQSVPPGRRPGLVTAAAVLLFILAAINLFIGLQLIGATQTQAGMSPEFLNGLGIFSLVIGAAQIFAGVKVLQLRRIGRTVGLIVAAIGVALALYSILNGVTLQVLALALNGFILFALGRNASSFAE